MNLDEGRGAEGDARSPESHVIAGIAGIGKPRATAKAFTAKDAEVAKEQGGKTLAKRLKGI
jgi:hypothetical protein